MKPYEIATRELGTKEIVGEKHNPEVLKYFSKVGHSWVKDDELAWCAAFVGYCLEECGIKSTRKLNARSYLDFGTETDNPQEEDIVVLSRGTNPAHGHVAFFVKFDGEKVVLRGGNQGNMVKDSRYNRSRILSIRDYDR